MRTKPINIANTVIYCAIALIKLYIFLLQNKVIEQNPSAAHVSVGDISERQTLRKNLGCKSFKWYLDNIYPELEMGEDTVAKKKIAALNDPDKNKFQPWHSR